MFPFQKIFTILIRTFSRPALQYIKKKQQTNNSSLLGRIFIRFGRRSHIIEQWVNYKILKNTTVKHYKQLKEEVYLQKGVQMSYQILFYIIVLGLPLWEMYKSAIAAQQKERKLRNRIITLQKHMIHINTRVKAIVQYSKQKNKQKQQLKIKSTLKSKDKDDDKLHNNTTIDMLGKMQVLGQISTQQASIGQKVEQIFENVLQVVGDQFQDVLDDIDISDDNLSAVQMQVQMQDIQQDIQIDTVDNVETDIDVGQSS